MCLSNQIMTPISEEKILTLTSTFKDVEEILLQMKTTKQLIPVVDSLEAMHFEVSHILIKVSVIPSSMDITTRVLMLFLLFLFFPFPPRVLCRWRTFEKVLWHSVL